MLFFYSIIHYFLYLLIPFRSFNVKARLSCMLEVKLKTSVMVMNIRILYGLSVWRRKIKVKTRGKYDEMTGPRGHH